MEQAPPGTIQFQVSVDDVYERMTDGQRQHMSNKLNKHGYRPQNLHGRHVEVDGREYVLIGVEK